MRKSELTRFFESTRECLTSSCTIWLRGVNEYGEAVFLTDSGAAILATAYVWPYHFGPVKGGQRINHTDDCSNFLLCVNPHHLRPGKIDERAKAKQLHLQHLEKHGPSPLFNVKRRFSDDQIRQIRKAYLVDKQTQQEIADTFKCQRMAISSILSYRTYKHVK